MGFEPHYRREITLFADNESNAMAIRPASGSSRGPAIADDHGRVTGNPEVIDSSVESVPLNALARTVALLTTWSAMICLSRQTLRAPLLAGRGPRNLL
jgi:hypothetical protein